jgi:hypothetical protein
MDEKTRKEYLKLISEKDKTRLNEIGEKVSKNVEELLNDILTLSVTTKYLEEEKEKTAAKTDLYFDGDIDIVLPKTGEKIDQQILDLHQKMVDLAMKNRRELISIFVKLFDLKDLAKLI